MERTATEFVWHQSKEIYQQGWAEGFYFQNPYDDSKLEGPFDSEYIAAEARFKFSQPNRLELWECGVCDIRNKRTPPFCGRVPCRAQVRYMDVGRQRI